MRGRAVAGLLLLSACAHSPGAPSVSKSGAPSGPLTYRILAERTVTQPCVSAPQFGIAAALNRWIDVYDMETQCHPKQTTIPLPDVDFDTEVAVAAWWAEGTCAARTAKIVSVAVVAGTVVVNAVTHGAPCTGGAEMESFFAIQHSDIYDGSQPVTFVLDRVEAGRALPGGF